MKMSVGAFVIIAVLASTSACTEEPDPGPDATTTDPAPTPTATATADPAGDIVPIDGDDSVSLEWTLEGDVSAEDPVVLTAQRAYALNALGSNSRDWQERDRLTRASEAIAAETSNVGTRTIDRWLASEPNVDGPFVMTVAAPEIDGDTAVVWLCQDTRQAFDEVGTRGTVRLELEAADGTWRLTDYNQRILPDDRDQEGSFFERCTGRTTTAASPED